MKPADPRTGKLLRWYPRAWRERYGEEFVALIQDTLDGRRPTWRLRLSVALAGLRERCYQATRTLGAAAKRHPAVDWWLGLVMLGQCITLMPLNLKASIPQARAWQGTAVLDALLAIAAFTCAAVLAGALVAFPAFVRFLQAGGWPKVRRRIAWAAGATVVAGGAFTGFVVAQRSLSLAQESQPGFIPVVFAASLPLVVALGLWTSAVTGLRKDLKLAPRARAAEVVLGAVIASAVSATVSTYFIWVFTVQLLVPWLLVAAVGLALTLSLTAPMRIRLAARRSRRILAAADRGR
jgi:hypothetical protein